MEISLPVNRGEEEGEKIIKIHHKEDGFISFIKKTRLSHVKTSAIKKKKNLIIFVLAWRDEE